MQKRGFSLIELMVVIAIMGVLMVYVSPTFYSFIVRGRVSSVIPIMKNYAQIGQEYYEAHGIFGNAQTLGLAVGALPNEIDNPTASNKYTTQQIVDIDGTGLCYNNIRFTLSGSELGIDQNIDIQMVVRRVNGMFQVTCGIPWDQDSSTYASVLKYFPPSCSDQNVSSC